MSDDQRHDVQRWHRATRLEKLTADSFTLSLS